ncbi:MAG: toxin-antitoxin system protein [Mycobacteriales bacterium]
MTTGSMTTIKVPKSLRERLSRDAAHEGLTAASFIEKLVDEHDREDRFDAVRRAYATTDAAYADETAEWDSLASDGLDP